MLLIASLIHFNRIRNLHWCELLLANYGLLHDSDSSEARWELWWVVLLGSLGQIVLLVQKFQRICVFGANQH